MIPNTALEDEDQEDLVAIISTSLSVVKPHHFFSWSQGAVQRLLPHETLVCGIITDSGTPARFHLFSSCHNFRDEIFNAVCDQDCGLIAQMMSYSRKTGRACLLGAGVAMGDFGKTGLPILDRYGLDNAAGHGLLDSDGMLRSYFCFFRIRASVGPRIEYLMQMLLPFLETTLNRVLANNKQFDEGSCSSAPAQKVSEREIQILNLIKNGKTNHEIAEILKLSPMTVKNHVQNTLKKLKANNRVHAVICAIERGLLK